MELDQIKCLFSDTDYARGMQYYLQKRVRNMRTSSVNGAIQVECQVRGTDLYSVMFRLQENHKLAIRCSCPRFDDRGICKHIAAAVIAYSMAPPPASNQTDHRVKAFLERCVERETRKLTPEAPARLIPKMIPGYHGGDDYPAFSFRVGRDKLYTVKHIYNFLENVRDAKTVELGKNLTLNHAIDQFDDRSRGLIRILMNEYPEFHTSGHWNGYSAAYRSCYEYHKNQITIMGDDFDRLFDLFVGTEIEQSDGSTTHLSANDPEVTLRLTQGKDCALLSVELDQPWQFFGNMNSLYALSSDDLYRCGESFRERVYPLVAAGLGQENAKLRLSLRDLPDFLSCVLPGIEDLAVVEDPDGLLEAYLPEECTPCFYFDMEDECLTLVLKFRYGDTEYSEIKGQGETVRRDARRERQAISCAQRYFASENGSYTLTGDDEVYDLLTGELDRFRELGEVYVSERLRRRQIPRTRAAVGISLSGGMLTLELDTGEFPAHELEALYQSLLKKKRYHRLADGRFLTLEGGAYEKLAEVTHILQLSPEKLEQGTLKIPAFRALYLDSALSDSKELNVTRDRQLREMIRDFKSLQESDHTVPAHLEGILRPYQKLGFQWLKTLDSCGFGGILADEMGLGKTLQIIAYLATVKQEKPGQISLVVCPASLILNWGEELARFAPELEFSLIYGSAAERKKRMEEGGTRDVWVTSYELLRQDIALYQELEFYACILDEGQHIKNQSTLISRAVKAISCRQRFVLTGTPIENRLSELWNLFDFLMPGYLFSHRAFVEKLEKPIIKSKNEEAMEQLRRLVRPFLLRRLKRDVLKDLPPKIELVRRIVMGETERMTYLSAVNAAKAELDASDGKLKILAALTRLRQVCCDPSLCFENYSGETSKLDSCLELCAGMAANGHQILLFSQFTSMLNILRERLNKLNISSFTLQGSTPKEQRAKLVREFNAGGASVFLISLKAGGTGLNLTAADVVIHYDPWWNLAAQNQATDRAHRIGQRQCVQVYTLIAKDTIEEKILDLQSKKAELLDVISGDGGSILEMSREELLALLD